MITMPLLKNSYTFPQLDQVKTLEQAEKYGLVKGVAITEGEGKNGIKYTADNVKMGGGAMRASAVMKNCAITIDHKKQLPNDYGIEGPYPAGYIIDAQPVVNNVAGKELTQLEFIAIIQNRQVYDMIKNNKFQGCSVEDYVRELSCQKGSCSWTGNAFLTNTLALKEPPNLPHTSVQVLEQADLDKFKQHMVLNTISESTDNEEDTTEANPITEKSESVDKEEPEKEEAKIDPEKEETEKPDLHKALADMEKRLDEKFATLIEKSAQVQYNTVQMKINDLKSKLPDVVLNTQQQTEYLTIKHEIEELEKKRSQ